MATPVLDGLGASMVGTIIAAARPAPPAPTFAARPAGNGGSDGVDPLILGGRLSILGIGLLLAVATLAYWYRRVL